MDLPSLADVIVIIVFLIPGFVSLVLFRWISIIERKMEDLETTVWSIFISLFIYAIFSAMTGITSIDSIREGIFQPSNLAVIMTLSLAIGGVSGAFTRLVLRDRVARGDCWDICMSRANRPDSWVIVHTQDGCEYKGILHFYGIKGENPHEIVIERPKLILRDTKANVTRELPMGSEILFLEKDIRRIVFFSNLRKKTGSESV